MNPTLMDAVAARCRLFGTFSLENASGIPVRLRSRRARALIAYLAMAGARGATRERLSGLLWSDRGEEQARASLRQCLLELKKALVDAGIDALEVGREQIVLKPNGLRSDVGAIEDAIQRQDGAVLAACLRDVGAEALLDDLSIGGLFDEWLQQTRAQLENAIELGVRRMIEAAEADGAWDRVRTLAEAFLLRSPADEAAAAAAIRADIALGSASAAHRRFRALESRLASEFGLRPGAAVSRALSASPERPAAAESAVAAVAASAPPSGYASPLVVVCAVEGVGQNEDLLALANAIRDEVVSGLSRFRDLNVVTDPQPSSKLEPRAFADPELAFVLAARILPGDRPGLTIQLLRLPARNIVWADRYEIPHGDILSATEAIVSKVVGAVLPSIDFELVSPPSHSLSQSGGVYLRYLRARQLATTATTHDAGRAAAAELEALIAANPSFVLPYLSLAYLYNTDFNNTLAGSSDSGMREKALALAKTAMSVDRGHVHSYTVLAWCYLRDRQWDPAQRLFDQALALNQFHAIRLNEVGFGLLFLGELDRARYLLDRCLLVNPTPDDHFFSDLGLLEMVTGHHDRAATHFALVANPTIWSSIYRAINCELAGRPAPQITERALQRISSIWPADRPMTDAAILDWIRTNNPFRQADVEARFLSGSRQVLDRASARSPVAGSGGG